MDRFHYQSQPFSTVIYENTISYCTRRMKDMDKLIEDAFVSVKQLLFNFSISSADTCVNISFSNTNFAINGEEITNEERDELIYEICRKLKLEKFKVDIIEEILTVSWNKEEKTYNHEDYINFII